MEKKIFLSLWTVVFVTVLFVIAPFTAQAEVSATVVEIMNGTQKNSVAWTPQTIKSYSYGQGRYIYESGSENLLSGPEVDEQGNYYYLRTTISDNAYVSYIFKNYDSDNENVPFITVEGDVSHFAIAADENSPYLYYKIWGESAIYRLPLLEGATGAESKFLDEYFYSQSFCLADDPDQFLIITEVDVQQIKVGLFSFNGGPDPIRTWSLTRAEDMSAIPTITFEASKGKVWLWIRDQVMQGSVAKWTFARYFSTSISGTDEFIRYDPAQEIAGWNTGNPKILLITRYGRLLWELESYSLELLRIRKLYTVSGEIHPDSPTVESWVDENNTTRPLQDLLTIDGGADLDGFLDNWSNLFLHVSSSGSSDWQRILIFGALRIANPRDIEMLLKLAVEFQVEGDALTVKLEQINNALAVLKNAGRFTDDLENRYVDLKRNLSSWRVGMDDLAPEIAEKLAMAKKDELVTRQEVERLKKPLVEYTDELDALGIKINQLEADTEALEEGGGDRNSNSGGGGGCSAFGIGIGLLVLTKLLVMKKSRR